MLRAAYPSVVLRFAAGLAVGALLLVSGCGGSSTPAEPATSPGAGSGTPTASKGAKVTDIVASVKDGKVSPKAHRVKVAVGSSVRILVNSDVDDEVHVHGYDIEREVSAGQPTTIEFTADQTGVFEVETHESDLLLFQLQVQ
jgi:plastocyanin